MNKELAASTPPTGDSARRAQVHNEAPAGTHSPLETRAGMAIDEVDNDFRTHWQTRYGDNPASRYEDLAPAYRFGHQRRNDQRHADHQWDEAEPEIRADWEQQNGSHPWEGVKEAIRYGWDKMTKSS